MAADICKSHGCDLHLSAVGEANVTNKMKSLEAVYGGEGNGGPIDTRVGFVRDSFVAMAQVLDAMAKNEKTIGQLAAAIPRYEICKTKIAIDRESIQLLYAKLTEQFSDATKSTMDGLRFDWHDKWILVRPSNTEPIVRAIAEASNESDAAALCQVAAELAANLSS